MNPVLLRKHLTLLRTRTEGVAELVARIRLIPGSSLVLVHLLDASTITTTGK